MDGKKRIADDIFKSVEKNDKAAALCLQASKLYAEKNYKEAIKLWRTASEDNNAEAFYMLGICYNYYQGVEDEGSKEECGAVASGYFLKAAELGHAEAQCFTALCYNYGIGVEKDDEKMLYWFKQSAAQNCTQAMNNLAYFAENGIGVKNPDKKYDEAFAWYKKSADLGDPTGQYGGGRAYYDGNGVESNYAEAVKWYTLAAEQGLAGALFSLGYCYDYGRRKEEYDSGV